MKKLLLITLMLSLVVGLSCIAVAAEDSVDTQFDVKVTNPTIKWVNGNIGHNFNVNSGAGFRNVYTHWHNFKVRSTTSYDIDVAVDCSDWDSGVEMNTENEAVGNKNWYSQAFDVRMTDRHGDEVEPQSGSSNGVTILENQSNTLKKNSDDNKSINNAVKHTIWLDLVLVDKDNTSGTTKRRRFDELPEGNHTTDVTLTVSEAL